MATARTSTTVRFTPEDLAIIDAAQERHGLLSRAEALRYVLRHYVRTELGGELKPKPKPRKK